MVFGVEISDLDLARRAEGLNPLKASLSRVEDEDGSRRGERVQSTTSEAVWPSRRTGVHALAYENLGVVCTIYDAMHSMSWILMQGGLAWVGSSSVEFGFGLAESSGLSAGSRMGWIRVGRVQDTVCWEVYVRRYRG